jgi:preprotein translocase subunit SecG
LNIYLNLAQIVVASALIVLVLLQTKGSALGGVFGGSDTSIHKTRRGLERTVFNATIGLSVVFFLLALINVVVSK